MSPARMAEDFVELAAMELVLSPWSEETADLVTALWHDAEILLGEESQ